MEEEKLQQRFVEKSMLQPFYQAWRLQRCSCTGEENRDRSFTITSSAIITHTCHFCFCANTFSGKILRVGLMSQVVNILVTFTENASLPLRGVYHCLFLLAVSEGTCFNSASPIEGILDMCKSKT